jgi:putative ABC transport system permease protein
MHHDEGPKIIRDSAASGEKTEDERQITNIIIQYRNPIAAINLPRLVQKMPNLQAASPALELNRMFSMLGFGISTINIIAGLLIGLSFLSIFFSMVNALKERRHELAIMRVMGGSRFRISFIIICESLLISLAGATAGIIFSRIMMYVLSTMVNQNYNYQISVFHFETAELWLLLVSLAVGKLAALYPAWKAYRQDISLTLRSQ